LSAIRPFYPGRSSVIIVTMPLDRRVLLRTGLAAGVVTLAGCSDAVPPPPVGATPGAPSGVPTPEPTLPDAQRQRLTQTLTRYLAPTPENPKHATYPGAVALVRTGGAVVAQVAVGDAVRYAAGPVELAPAKRVAMRADAIFDLASVTKVYTAVLGLQLVEQGKVELAAPVVDYLPGFTGAGKAGVTVAMLLTHTSGLAVGASVAGRSGDAARRAAVLATPLVPGAVPGRVFRYSSVGLMVLGQLVELLTGQRLDEAVRARITEPLGLRDTGFRPLTWTGVDRIVATDARSSRGLLRGVVHDEVANAMGGVAGHAGLFSTAADLGVFGQALLNGGAHQGTRILAEATVRTMLTNANPGLPAVDPDRPGRSADHGLGVELNQPWFMGALASPRTFGHTGFTGTSLLVDSGRGLVLVLLTNRAHPQWSWSNPDPARAAVASVLA
jgi:CubicO group peptidase (beta-lactamase class C family)